MTATENRRHKARGEELMRGKIDELLKEGEAKK